MQRLVAAVLVLVAGAAEAAPTPAAPGPGNRTGLLATASADVDGDGAADALRVEAGGTLVVETARGRATFAVGDTAKATLAAGGPKGQVMIVVAARRAEGTEAIALAWRSGQLALVWRGPVGPVGRDGEHDVVVEPGPRGLVRYQTRRDVARCDGVPAQLFAEGWDGSRQGFRPIRADVRVPDSAPVLSAVPLEGAAPAALVFRAAVASTAAGAGDASSLGAPRELGDGDAATVWREERGSDGRGEFFTFRATLPGASAAALRIATAGGAATNRVARVAVVSGDVAYHVDVPDPVRRPAARDVWVRFPAPIRAACVSVVIEAVHRAAGAAEGGGQTAIGELQVLAASDLEAGGGEAALAAQVTAGGDAARTATRLLAARGAAGAAALQQQRARADLPAGADPRLFRALVANGHASAGADLAAGLAAARSEGSLAELEAVLATMSPSPAPALAAVLADDRSAPAGRRAAARLLAADPGPEARAALLAAAGRGPAELRVEVARGLARGEIAALLAAARGAGDDARGADLWRAVADAARARDTRAGDRAAALDAMAERLARGGGYELRYRLVVGLAALGAAAQVAAVERALASGTGAGTSALRAVAAQALARNPAAEARRMLTRLLGDADPGVRLAAVKASADGDGGRDPSADESLGAVLARDAWPELRRAATAALGARCPRPGPTRMLEGAADRDADVDVRGDALAALVGCRAPGVAARLLAIARDGGAPPMLRLRAVDLIGALADRAQVPALLGLFADWRRAAMSEDTALGLAVRAAVVLGRLGDVSVVPALLDAAGDTAFPELQAAAATGLGELRGGCPPAARATLDDLARSEERSVALAAKRARARCGAGTP